MKTHPEDFWTTLKTSWAPQPRWLNTEVGDLSDPPDETPVFQAPVHYGHEPQPPCDMDLKGDVASPPGEEGRLPLKIKRKNQRDSRAAGPARVERDLSATWAAQSISGKPAASRCEPAHKTTLPRNVRTKKRPVRAGNVVELRPYLRDEIYAAAILNALCAACEAHAAGEDELLMSRIRNLYHMFEYVADDRRA